MYSAQITGVFGNFKVWVTIDCFRHAILDVNEIIVHVHLSL
jgi:hypothetical protein